MAASAGTVSKFGTRSGTWNWSFPTTDGPAEGQTITITADDGHGGTAMTSFDLAVNNLPPSVQITGAPASGAPGVPIALVSTVSDPGTADTAAGFTYAWNVTRGGAPFASGTGASFGFTPDLPGDYEVHLSVTDKDGAAGTATATIAATTSSNRPPSADAGSDQTVEATSPVGASVTLNGNGSSDPDGDALGYTWTGAFGTASGPSPTVALPLGTHAITLNVDDGQGGTAADSVSVAVADTTPPAILCPADVATTLGETVTLGTPGVTDAVDPDPAVTNDAPAGFPLGTTVVTWTASDDSGNHGTCQQSASVSYAFTGFFPPVDNLPVYNQVQAGSGIPVKFSLGGNQGLAIFAAGYPTSQGIGCSAGATVDAIEETVTAGSSGLSYDPSTDQYTYVWKTNKAWAGTCRQLIVRLKDGTDHKANFKFK